MKDRIQKLCKRLNRFTLEEISLIAELDESEIKPILKSLIGENLLIKHDANYVYNNIEKKSKLAKHLPMIFEYQSRETIDMIMNCFCAEIQSYKVGLILKPEERCICKFYNYFRDRIYEIQKQKLIEHFKKTPQQARFRMFFDKPFYFYYYNNCLYISEELFESKNGKVFSKTEIRDFKKMYLILCRRVNFNYYKNYTHLHLAEQIWRHKKEFHQLKNELKIILFN